MTRCERPPLRRGSCYMLLLLLLSLDYPVSADLGSQDDANPIFESNRRTGTVHAAVRPRALPLQPTACTSPRLLTPPTPHPPHPLPRSLPLPTRSPLPVRPSWSSRAL